MSIFNKNLQASYTHVDISLVSYIFIILSAVCILYIILCTRDLEPPKLPHRARSALGCIRVLCKRNFLQKSSRYMFRYIELCSLQLLTKVIIGANYKNYLIPSTPQIGMCPFNKEYVCTSIFLSFAYSDNG